MIEKIPTVRWPRGANAVRDVPRVVKPYEYDPTMGEVRTNARLTNALDASLGRRQQLPADQVRTYAADALVDTGAVRTVIPAEVVQALGIQIWKQTTAEYADGRREQVGMTEPILIDIDGRETFDEALVLGDEVLIGQTVLEKLDLYVDCAGQRLVPNPANPDQPVSKVK